MPKTLNHIICMIAVLAASCAIAEETPVSKNSEASPASLNEYSSTEMSSLMNSVLEPEVPPEEWGDRNPFDTSEIQDLIGKPSGPGQPQQPGIKGNIMLQGIFLGSSKPSAIISGVIVGIGDQVKDSTVKSIEKNMVILEDNKGAQTVLSLRQQ